VPPARGWEGVDRPLQLPLPGGLVWLNRVIQPLVMLRSGQGGGQRGGLWWG
jgi:hypothetical protein